MTEQNKKMIFQEIGELWLRVDSRNPDPPTLAEVLYNNKFTIQ